MIIKIFNHTYTYVLILDYLSGQGKMEISQGKVGEKSENFVFLYEWQPCTRICYHFLQELKQPITVHACTY